MRLVFEEPKGHKPLEQLLHEAREQTGIVIPEDSGFKFILNDGQFPHIYLHKGHSYLNLRPADLRHFQELFEYLHRKIFYDGIPAHYRSLLGELVATNEHYDYSPAAIEKLPGHVLSTRYLDEAELGAWGTFDKSLVEEAAKAMKFKSVEEYLQAIIPVFTYKEGQPILKAHLRANRPGASQNSPKIQQQVFQSIHYGHPNNNQALKDILFSMNRIGKPVAAEELGPLVDGAAIVLSLDSEYRNKKYLSVLDRPLTIESRVRDLSPLSIAGVQAVSVINRFSSLARHIDEKLYLYLEKIGIEIPKGNVQLNGKPILAEGVCIVTYSTGFETDYSDMTKEKIVAMYKSLQLAIKRIMQQLGYENASYMVGENIGKGAGATLIEKHLQAYVSKNVSIKPAYQRITPTEDNVLFHNDSVYIIAHPESYGQVVIQFKDDKDFLERNDNELGDYAEARLYNFHKLNKIGITSDRNIYSLGNDFSVRPVPEGEKFVRLGFFEHGAKRRIGSTDNFSPLELAANIPGDQKQFIEMYRKSA